MYWLASLVTLVGVIWITVNAFRKDGPLHGIFCFICGIYTLYYGIKNFAENKIPLIMVVVGVIASILLRPDMSALQAAAGG